MIAAIQTSSFIQEEKFLLRALLYFDIFDYPLTQNEIVRFSPVVVNSSCEQLLESLVRQNIIFRFGDFYSIKNDPSLAERRQKGNALAEKRMRNARTYSRLVASFPFVRAVLLSGSISKGFMDEKSDIDYFIITDSQRMWIVRTALAVFRRVFLFNSHKNLCTNYLIDTQNLCIPDRNIFAAMELCTLKPMYGKSVIEDFQSANRWIVSFLPNTQFEKVEVMNRFFLLKGVIEKILSFPFFNNLNDWLRRKTLQRWKKRYAQGMNQSDFEIAFRSTDGVSKSHPQFFQKQVLTRYEQKIKGFEALSGLDLTI